MKESLKDTFEILLGGKEFSYYLANFIFSSFGLYIALFLFAKKKRDVSSPRTPEKFSHWFLIIDNAKKAFGIYICLYILYRFTPEFEFSWSIPIGIVASGGVAALVNIAAELVPGFKKFIQLKQLTNETTPSNPDGN
ncbi:MULTISPECIES: hypothetical protein [unclassified Paraflavitalea]|jgi:hypothetical protein|uniref:hypothetical protein n=1 Tax=unclassified Paraflavitalea TaxID=2798305 RepID=UPI003D34D056